MHDQHFYESPAVDLIVAVVTSDYYYSDWGYLVNFSTIQSWRIAYMAENEMAIQDRVSQSGAYDFSAMPQRPIFIALLGKLFQFYFYCNSSIDFDFTDIFYYCIVLYIYSNISFIQ